MAKAAPTFRSKYFSLQVKDVTEAAGVRRTHLHITDRFHRLRHRPERLVFGGVTKVLESYLKQRPHLHFHHPKNHARRVVYVSPAVKAWAKFMPGGFATYPVHNPDVKRLSDGHKVDYVARNLFRHATDAIGLRSRAYAMTWYLHERFGARTTPVRWLSIAAGTGQPTFDAVRLFAVKPHFVLTDINEAIMEFARNLAQKYGLDEEQVEIRQLDISNRTALRDTLDSVRPDVVEMMGLMEYLDDKTVIGVVKEILPRLPKGAVFVFTNMRTDHPELLTHKHAVGWPGVIQRSVDEVATLLKKAGVPGEAIDVLLPDDNVYAVYCIKKP